MNTLREAARQALDWLENGDFVYPTKIATDLRAALAEPDDDSLTAAYMLGRYDAKKAEPQEPVANIGCLGMPVNTPVTAPQPKAEPQSGIKQVVELYDSPEHEPVAVKAAWMAGYTEGQKDAWAEQAKPQEPVAFKLQKVGKDHSFRLHTVLTVDDFGGDKAAFLAYGASDPELTPLFTEAPQPRKRLTDQQILDIGEKAGAVEGQHMLPVTFARAIEAAVWGDGK